MLLNDMTPGLHNVFPALAVSAHFPHKPACEEVKNNLDNLIEVPGKEADNASKKAVLHGRKGWV